MAGCSVRSPEMCEQPWIVRACLRIIPGAKLEYIYERLHIPWLVVTLLGPVHVGRVIAMVIVFGYGTGWHPVYYPLIFIQAGSVVSMLWSLRYPLKTWQGMPANRVWDMLMMLNAYAELALPYAGFLSNKLLHFVPFRNPPLLITYAFLEAPCITLIGSVGTPHLVNIDAGSTALAIVTFHACNALRMVDAYADSVLGLRMIISASAGGLCLYNGRTNCRAHITVGAVITVATLIDFALAIISTQLSHRVLLFLSNRARRVLLELMMVMCEGTIFICSLIILKTGMAEDDTDSNKYQDMRMYTVVCGVSTFFAFGITVILLVVPGEVWEKIDKGGFKALKIIGIGTAKISHHSTSKHSMGPEAGRIVPVGTVADSASPGTATWDECATEGALELINEDPRQETLGTLIQAEQGYEIMDTCRCRLSSTGGQDAQS